MIKRYTCFRCGRFFEQGELFHSDAPGVIYHLRCYIATVKAEDGV